MNNLNGLNYDNWKTFHGNPYERDVDETVYYSNCCGAELYEETDICMECGEHCEAITKEELEILNHNDKIAERLQCKK